MGKSQFSPETKVLKIPSPPKYSGMLKFGKPSFSLESFCPLVLINPIRTPSYRNFPKESLFGNLPNKKFKVLTSIEARTTFWHGVLLYPI